MLFAAGLGSTPGSRNEDIPSKAAKDREPGELVARRFEVR
jgi:hypothetical protein